MTPPIPDEVKELVERALTDTDETSLLRHIYRAAKKSPLELEALACIFAKRLTAQAERIAELEGAGAPQDRVSRDRDIILQAINEFDSWMLDDDYDADRVLRLIIDRMKERIAFTAQQKGDVG